MKRTKREIIIIVCMAVAVLYGGYALFLDKPSQSKAPVVGIDRTQEIDQIIADISSALKVGQGSVANAYLLARAESGWIQDPFYKEKMAVKDEAELGLKFTGYLEIGRQKFAIINGVDYTTGDELEMGGYLVTRISPLMTTIKNTLKGFELTIPFIED